MPSRRTHLARAAVAITIAFALHAPPAVAQEDQLRAAIAAQMAQASAAEAAYVVDLTDGHVVFDDRSETRLLSASVTKLYTTATALT